MAADTKACFRAERFIEIAFTTFLFPSLLREVSQLQDSHVIREVLWPWQQRGTKEAMANPAETAY